MPDKIEFARKMLIECVKEYADHAGVSQTKLAEITGLHRSNINRVLSGRYSPELDTFLKIAGALNLHLQILRGSKGNNTGNGGRAE